MNTCRLCGNDDFSGDPLIKYGVRHYVHAECAFKKWGESFLDKIASVAVGAVAAPRDQTCWHVRCG